ncbi:MAG: hypothetical protein JWM55_1223, partial [Acidimicrobiaceae bacterium]|nr:hypothetical protein [Acidimicrobiaceae bacterium]
ALGTAVSTRARVSRTSTGTRKTSSTASRRPADPLGPHDSVPIEHKGDGIDTLLRVGDAPDQLQFRVNELANVDSYFIDTSPDSIGRYAQEYIHGAGSPRSSAHRDKKFENLARRARENGPQAHFALVATFPKNSGVWHALSLRHIVATWDYDLLRQLLELPDGIQGFWVMYPDFSAGVAYIAGSGWRRFPS